jgi:hypothetical protein
MAALDPYASLRIEPYAAMQAAPVASAPRADGVFAFLDMRGKEAIDAVEALGRLAQDAPVSVHLRGPGARASAGHLSRRGARVHLKPADMSEVLAEAKVVVTQGGHGMAMMALQAGRYNLVLPLHFESMLNGLAVERLGVGKVVWGGGETFEAHLHGLRAQPAERALAVAGALAAPAPFDAEAFVAALMRNQRRGKPSAASPRRGQRSHGSVGGGERGSSYSSHPSMKPAA